VAKKATTMKWHLVDEDSLEERVIDISNWYRKDQTALRTYGSLMCGGNKHEWKVYNPYSNNWYDMRIPLILKDTVNLNGSGVCTYCKNYRLNELGLKQKVMG
jgi:hypothetical protein